MKMRIFPDPVLRKKASKVIHFGRELKTLVRDMEKTMRSQKHGIGIAAPQIGVSQRIFVMDVSGRVEGAEKVVMVNPVRLQIGPPRFSREGCMSLPDYSGNLKRYEWVHVRWQDENGDFHEKTFEGIEAVCVQHEMDHLDGILFMDRVTCLKTDMIPRKKK